jgi:hypothetical protein
MVHRDALGHVVDIEEDQRACDLVRIGDFREALTLLAANERGDLIDVLVSISAR